MNVNVSPTKLREFAKYVGDFSRGLVEDCQELAEALSQLDSSLSESEREDVKSMVQDIIRILRDGQPTLRSLKGEIEGYADYVEEFQRLAKG